MEDFQLAIGFFFINLYRNLRVAVGLPASAQEEMYRQLASSMPRLGRLAENIDVQTLHTLSQAGVVSFDEVQDALGFGAIKSYAPLPEYEDMLIPYPD